MGLTPDCHIDFIEPVCILLVPLKELPKENARRDVYEAIDSEIIVAWATNATENRPVTVSALR